MNSETPSSRLAEIEQAAADWLIRRARGLSSVEEQQFALWRQDPAHAAAFAELDTTWKSLDQIRHVSLPNGEALDHDIPAAPAPNRRVQWPAVAALAAALAVAALVGVRTWQRDGGIRSVATEIGGFQKTELPDGSVVRLNTDSAIEVHFSVGERRVLLARGEANFEVVKDHARPFVVQAGPVKVRAVGTAFNVRLRTGAVDVLVTEGRVAVDDAATGASLLPNAEAKGAIAEEAVLAAGQRIAVADTPENPGTPAPAPRVVEVAAEEIQRELAWQERRLEFESTPLRQVVEEFNRYNTHKLVIADPRLEDRRFGGSFAADNSEAFVRLLEARFSVRAERIGNESRLRLDR
jgi:transmembrane sensor